MKIVKKAKTKYVRKKLREIEKAKVKGKGDNLKRKMRC